MMDTSAFDDFVPAGGDEAAVAEMYNALDDDVKALITATVKIFKHVIRLAVMVAALFLCVVIYCFVIAWICLFWIQTRLFLGASRLIRNSMSGPRSLQSSPTAVSAMRPEVSAVDTDQLEQSKTTLAHAIPVAVDGEACGGGSSSSSSTVAPDKTDLLAVDENKVQIRADLSDDWHSQRRMEKVKEKKEEFGQDGRWHADTPNGAKAPQPSERENFISVETPQQRWQSTFGKVQDFEPDTNRHLEPRGRTASRKIAMRREASRSDDWAVEKEEKMEREKADPAPEVKPLITEDGKNQERARKQNNWLGWMKSNRLDFSGPEHPTSSLLDATNTSQHKHNPFNFSAEQMADAKRFMASATRPGSKRDKSSRATRERGLAPADALNNSNQHRIVQTRLAPSTMGVFGGSEPLTHFHSYRYPVKKQQYESLPGGIGGNTTMVMASATPPHRRAAAGLRAERDAFKSDLSNEAHQVQLSLSQADEESTGGPLKMRADATEFRPAQESKPASSDELATSWNAEVAGNQQDTRWTWSNDELLLINQKPAPATQDESWSELKSQVLLMEAELVGNHRSESVALSPYQETSRLKRPVVGSMSADVLKSFNPSLLSSIETTQCGQCHRWTSLSDAFPEMHNAVLCKPCFAVRDRIVSARCTIEEGLYGASAGLSPPQKRSQHFEKPYEYASEDGFFGSLPSTAECEAVLLASQNETATSSPYKMLQSGKEPENSSQIRTPAALYRPSSARLSYHAPASTPQRVQSTQKFETWPAQAMPLLPSALTPTSNRTASMPLSPGVQHPRPWQNQDSLGGSLMNSGPDLNGLDSSNDMSLTYNESDELQKTRRPVRVEGSPSEVDRGKLRIRQLASLRDFGQKFKLPPSLAPAVEEDEPVSPKTLMLEEPLAAAKSDAMQPEARDAEDSATNDPGSTTGDSKRDIRERKRVAREAVKLAWCQRENARVRLSGTWSVEDAQVLRDATENYHEKRDNLIAQMAGGTLNEQDAKTYPPFADKNLQAPKVKPAGAEELRAELKRKQKEREDSLRDSNPVQADGPSSVQQELIKKLEGAQRLCADARDQYTQPRPQSNVSYDTWRKDIEAKVTRARDYYRKKYKAVLEAFPDGLPQDLAERFTEQG